MEERSTYYMVAESQTDRIDYVMRAVMFAIAVAVLCAAVPALSDPPQTPVPKLSGNHIAIHCDLKILQLWSNTELVREYPIEVGKGGLGKRVGGDHRTPIGEYEISWMASRNSSKGHKIIDGRSWCKGNNFIEATTGPALEKLWAEPYGGDEAAIMSINYPNEKDRARGFTGECIHIHSDKRHENGILKKSYGCIHMFPHDARELYEWVQVGTPVKILP
ncbi:MAG TPA: L,D-transpeptidase [Desulfomonilaceae bacterium]|nr:L,D-transpeptidase [Desulfomonilaceae bacterium]